MMWIFANFNVLSNLYNSYDFWPFTHFDILNIDAATPLLFSSNLYFWMQKNWGYKTMVFSSKVVVASGGELLKIWLLDNQLVDTFGRKSTARHKIYRLLESS